MLGGICGKTHFGQKQTTAGSSTDNLLLMEIKEWSYWDSNEINI